MPAIELQSESGDGFDSAVVLSSALESAGVGVFVQDAEHAILYANALARQMLGTRGSGLIGRATLPDGSALRSATDPGSQAISDGQPVTSRLMRLRAEDGSSRWIQVSARPLKPDGLGPGIAVCACLDVDSLVRERDHAQMLAEALDNTLSATGISTWEADVRAKQVRFGAGNFALYEIEPHEFDGSLHGWLRLIEADDVIATQQAVTEALAGRAPLDHRYRVRRKDGSLRYVRIRGRVRRDAQGHPIAVHGVAYDVTDQVRETEQVVSEGTSDQASRLHSEMLLRMGHDLRSPLNAMMGFAQLIDQHSGPVPDTVRANAQQISTAGSHMLKLLSELLELSRARITPRESESRPVDLAQALTPCLSEAQKQADQRGVRLELGIPAPLHARADPTGLVRAMAPLLNFAIRRSPSGSQVRVSATLNERLTPARICIRIADNAPGLSEAERLELLEPFSLSSRLGADQDNPDNGLHLALSQALLQRMGGSVSALTSDDSALILEIRLPTCAIGPDEPHENAAAAAANTPADGLRKTRVLYIEDNRLNIAVLSSLFRQTPGYEFVYALDGQSGIEAAHRMRPDIVLLDINLPGMTGDQVFQRFRESELLATIPCIAVSANALPDEVARYRAMGFSEYLTKPFNLRVLLDLVGRLSKPTPMR